MSKTLLASKQIILTFHRIFGFVFFLIMGQLTFAQSEQITEDEKEKLNLNNTLKPTKIDFDFDTGYSGNFFNANTEVYPDNLFFLKDIKNRPEVFPRLTFNQNSTQSLFPNLGGYEHYNNSISYKASDKISINADLGLALQNSVYNTDDPNLQFSFYSSFSYSFNNWLSAYIYGQYVTLPLGKNDGFYDPLMYMNPLFLQNEVGAGLRAKSKNVTFDLKVTKMYKTELKQRHSFGNSQSALIIGF